MSAPLCDEEAERAVLGAIVIRHEALDDLADVLEPEHFGRQHHQQTFRAMQALHTAGQPVDGITLSAQLARDGALDDETRGVLHKLGSGVPKSLNVVAYALEVRDKALLRRLREVGRQTVAAAESASERGEVLLERTEQAIYSLGVTAVRGDWTSSAELANELYTAIERMQQQRQSISGVPTGFADLDVYTNGWQPGDLVLVGARPSMGKTAFALQVALAAARSLPVAFFSLEMARVPIGLRAVVSLAQLDSWRMFSGQLQDVEFTRASSALTTLGEATFYLDESPMLSPLQARSKLRRLKAKVGKLGLVVIDYLQLMAAMPEDRRENKTNQVAGISRALKLMAREFGVPFLVLSQLNRGLENSTEKRPTMASLRDSGALEQDADVVLMLHRPEVYEPNDERLKGLAEVIIAKQRNGRTGTVRLVWRASHMRFEEGVRV